MRKTQMDGERMYYGLNLHMLEVLGKYHDEDLCILQAVLRCQEGGEKVGYGL